MYDCKLQKEFDLAPGDILEYHRPFLYTKLIDEEGVHFGVKEHYRQDRYYILLYLGQINFFNRTIPQESLVGSRFLYEEKVIVVLETAPKLQNFYSRLTKESDAWTIQGKNTLP